MFLCVASCKLFCHLLTYLFTYWFFYLLLCINVVNLLSIKKKKKSNVTTANLLLAAHLNIRAWDQSQWTVFFNVIWNLKKDERENFKNFSGTLVRPLGTPHKHQKGLKISESECWISLGKWSSLDSFSNALGQHQIHLNLYWIALKSNRTLYVYSVYLTLIFHTAKLNTNIANYHFSGNWIITSVGAVHRKLGTLSSMRLQKGKESLYNTFWLNRKRKLKSKRK